MGDGRETQCAESGDHQQARSLCRWWQSLSLYLTERRQALDLLLSLRKDRAEGKLIRREMGLGGAARGQVSLAAARRKADEARALLRQGIDPLDARKASEQALRTIL
jgi:hypothetical protein